MKISIIVPIYNVQNYIIKCLESVFNQHYNGNIECILVNDCTPDDSMKMVKQFINGHHRENIEFVVLNHNENKGLSGARNTGLLHATGDYVYFLDSDDYITNNCIELFVENVLETGCDFAISNYFVNNSTQNRLHYKENVLIGRKKILEGLCNAKWYIMAWNKLCKRSFLLENNLFFEEGLIHEDEMWSFQLACKATKVGIIQNCTYHYIIRPNSITTQKCNENKHLDAYLKIFSIMYRYYKEEIEYRNLLYIHINNTVNAQLTHRAVKTGINSFYAYYRDIREIISFNPFKYFVKKEISFSNLITGLHFFLPIRIAALYALAICYFKKIKKCALS